MKFKLDENLPASSAAILEAAGPRRRHRHRRGPDRSARPRRRRRSDSGGPDTDLLDRGLGDIRSYPPGSHAGIVVLRLADQSPATVSKAITDRAELTEATSLGGAVAVLQRGLLRLRHP